MSQLGALSSAQNFSQQLANLSPELQLQFFQQQQQQLQQQQQQQQQSVAATPVNMVQSSIQNYGQMSESTGNKKAKKIKEEKTPAKKAAKKTPGASAKKPTSSKKASAASCRYDSSLGLLTKKFVVLLQEADEGVLDLNTAATKLGVQKRRIYDITNVLEGIGLIEKKSKNNIKWKGDGLGSMTDMRKEASGLRHELSDLETQEQTLDRYLQRMQVMLRELAEHRDNAPLAYVTHEDIRALPIFKNETLIAIKAPSGTTLEVPHPDQGMDEGQRRFQVYMRSSSGPIDVYLLSEHDNMNESQQQQSQKASDNFPSTPLSKLANTAATASSLPLSTDSKEPQRSLRTLASSPSFEALSDAAHHPESKAAPAFGSGIVIKAEPAESGPEFFMSMDPSSDSIADLY